jgi:glycerol-3-phosphate O-acyltransferase
LPDSLLFLERRTGFFGQRIDRRMPDALRVLATAAGSDMAFNPELMPVSLFWGRAPDRERTWLRLLSRTTGTSAAGSASSCRCC